MGLWSAIKDAFSGKDDATRIKEMAAELSRYADRYANADDAESAALARDYARRVSAARTLKEARALYNEFQQAISKYHDADVVRRERETYDEPGNDQDDDWSDDS